MTHKNYKKTLEHIQVELENQQLREEKFYKSIGIKAAYDQAQKILIENYELKKILVTFLKHNRQLIRIIGKSRKLITNKTKRKKISKMIKRAFKKKKDIDFFIRKIDLSLLEEYNDRTEKRIY